MELAIRPDDLHAAAVALSACASHLDDAARRFNRTAHRNVPHLGMKGIGAAGEAVAVTEHALQILHGDITALARALDGLAQHYPRVDRTAVTRR